MTTNNPPVAPRRQGGGAGRVLAIVSAVFLLLIGAGLAIGGGALMAVFGTDSEISSPRNPVTTPTAAVVTDIAVIRDTSEVADALGTPVAKVAAEGGNASGLFVGIGPAVAVDRYLAGVEIDQAVDFDVDPYALDLSRRDGAETTADPPTDQDFWVASANSATGIELSWPIQDGNYRMVLMNADGAADVQSQVSIGLGLGSMFGVALGMLIGGVLLIAVAIALLVFTRPRRLPPAPAYPGGYPAAGPPTGTPTGPPAGPPAGAAPPSAPPTAPAQPGQAQSGQARPAGAVPYNGDTPPVEPPPVREPLG